MNLKSKKIKVNGKKYTVSDHEVNEEGVETLTLSRKLRRKIETLQDLGVSSVKELRGNEEEKMAARAYLKSHNPKIPLEIALLEKSGNLREVSLFIIARDFADPEMVQVKYKDDYIEVHESFIMDALVLKKHWEEAKAEANIEINSHASDEDLSPESEPDDKIEKIFKEIFQGLLKDD